MKTCNLPRISHDLLTGGAFLRFNGKPGMGRLQIVNAAPQWQMKK